MSDTIAPVKLLRRHVLAALMGNALEFYDFLTYAFFSIQIGHAFFPRSGAYGGLMLSLGLFMAGFVTRPLGALVLGAFADRRGRRPAMMISYLMMGASIVLMALIPSYSQIGLAAPILALAARAAQGFSLGGEVGSNTAFLSEAADPARRGLIVSWQGATQYIAGAFGSLVGVSLAATLAPAVFDAWGWRIAFLIGAASLPFGLWLRHGLPETLHLDEGGPAPMAAAEPRLRTAGRYRRVLILGMLILGTGSIGTYILNYFATYAQNTLHMRPLSGLWSEVMASLVSAGVLLFGGWLSDRIGRRPVMVWGNLAFLLLIWPMFAWLSAARSEPVLLIAPTILAVFANITGGPIYATLCESIPKAIRGAGFAIIYALGVAIAGGTTQLIVTWLLHVTGDPMAPAWYMIAATGVAQVCFWLLRESAPCRVEVPWAAAASAPA